jgi:hypothetical protein
MRIGGIRRPVRRVALGAPVDVPVPVPAADRCARPGERDRPLGGKRTTWNGTEQSGDTPVSRS